jgi:leader peptidase (prepilin peptidase)/N-methyltransferase
MPLFLDFELPAFLIGLLFGSFLNVCISRLPKHQSISKPRSHCPHCNHVIRWYDNIPLLSFVFLRAHCRHCKAPISWRYPFVELALGLWFARIASDVHGLAIAWHAATPVWLYQHPDVYYQAAILLSNFFVLGFLLIGLLVMDWETHKLPDAFTIPGICIGFLLACLQAMFLSPGQYVLYADPNIHLGSMGPVNTTGNIFLTGPEHLVYGRILAILFAGLLLVLIREAYKLLRNREGMGLGDAKLLAMIAAFLGFWPAMLALFCGVILCSFYAITLLVRRKAHSLTRLPLGTFLAIGGLIAALFSTPLITWYTGLF